MLLLTARSTASLQTMLPHSEEEKADFEKAPNGVVGLETSLAMTLTRLYHTGKANLSKDSRAYVNQPKRNFRHRTCENCRGI